MRKKRNGGYALASTLVVMLVLSALCGVLLTGAAGDVTLSVARTQQTQRRRELDEIGMDFLRNGEALDSGKWAQYTLDIDGRTLRVIENGELLLTVETDENGSPIRWENLG